MVSACLPSDALSQHLPSYCGFSFLGRGVSPPGPRSWPWMWGDSSLHLNAAQPIENIDIHLKQSLKRHAYNNSGFRCCKVELPSFPNFFYFISKARWLEYKINITQCFCTWFNCEASCLDLNETSTLRDTNILRKKLKSSHLKLILFLSLPPILQEPSHLLLLCKILYSYNLLLLLLLLSRFNRVRLCGTPEKADHQAPLSLGFSRQEHWSGLPFPSSMHESEKWKWSRSVVSDS